MTDNRSVFLSRRDWSTPHGRGEWLRALRGCLLGRPPIARSRARGQRCAQGL